MRALCTGTKSRIGFWLAVSLVVATAGLAAQSAGPKIRAVWSSSGGQGGVLNVSVSGLPPGAQVEVTVVDQTSGGKTESPVGTPPGTADGQGNWPGALAGSQVGYPDTSTDPGGTKYVVSVKVNGKTRAGHGGEKTRRQPERDLGHQHPGRHPADRCPGHHRRGCRSPGIRWPWSTVRSVSRAGRRLVSGRAFGSCCVSGLGVPPGSMDPGPGTREPVDVL